MKNLITIFLHAVFLSRIHTNGNPLEGAPEHIKPAMENEFPFFVSLAEAPADQPDDHFCGGTLISKNHILTATHCFVNPLTDLPYLNTTDIVVKIGSIDLMLGRNIGIKYWTTYEEWAQRKNIAVSITTSHDLSVAMLSEEVTDIAPAFISQCKHRQIRGRKAVAAGRGLMNGGFQPRMLQKATLHVLARKKCRFNFEQTDAVPSLIVNHLCTIQYPLVALACGDSGGPLLINGNELIGVNKAVCANNITHPNEQNVHESVEYYRKFIEDFAERTAPCPFKC